MPGTIEGLINLSQRGYDIVFVTSPYRPCKTFFDVRMEWIESRLWSDPEVHFCLNKFRVMGDLMIDDKIENVETWERVHVRG